MENGWAGDTVQKRPRKDRRGGGASGRVCSGQWFLFCFMKAPEMCAGAWQSEKAQWVDK